MISHWYLCYPDPCFGMVFGVIFGKMCKKEIWEAREHFITELDDMTLADVWWD